MISVCLATYNGARYLGEQLDSILAQLGPSDEVVICDDQSTDETLAVLAAYDDQRIVVHRNEARLGHVRNFEKAMSLARGDTIFLSDQDDVWLPERVSQMVAQLRGNASTELVASNFDLIDGAGAFTGEFRSLGPVKSSRLAQLFDIFAGRAPYFGCTFAMKKSLLDACMPIPKGIESHDIWIAMVACARGAAVNMAQPTLLHRVHDRNVTAKRRRSLAVVLRSRLVFLRALIVRLLSIKFKFNWGARYE